VLSAASACIVLVRADADYRSATALNSSECCSYQAPASNSAADAYWQRVTLSSAIAYIQLTISMSYDHLTTVLYSKCSGACAMRATGFWLML
jgi:hypothetical protein